MAQHYSYFINPITSLPARICKGAGSPRPKTQAYESLVKVDGVVYAPEDLDDWDADEAVNSYSDLTEEDFELAESQVTERLTPQGWKRY